MKVRTFTKKDVAAEIANRLDATLLDSLTFTDELFLVLRDMLTCLLYTSDAADE